MNSQRQVIFNESALTLEKLSILKAWAEVYIVSMKNEIVLRSNFDTIEENTSGGGGDEDDEFGDFEESNSTTTNNNNNNSNGTNQGKSEKKEGLGSLVQSELPSLSKHWLNALRDHGLLSLPSEFKSQLPYDGGAFYTHDTINLARPHYRYVTNFYLPL